MNTNYETKYNGERLIATYQVQDSKNIWWDKQVYINSQDEFNKLINACNCDGMNLVDIQKDI